MRDAITKAGDQMLTDLHAHTSAISRCCEISAEDNIILAREHGFDAIAITNHYTEKNFKYIEYDRWIENYLREWEDCRALGKKHGVHIFCGTEVTLEPDRRLHLLIYGADEEFIIKYPHLSLRSQKELFELCKAHSYALVQAHPFRGGTTILDTNYLHGIEINCHPLYENSYYEEILEAAKRDHLAVTAGCDYHADTYRPDGGTYLPDDVLTDRDLSDYILSSSTFDLKIHDPVTKNIFNIQYKKD